MKERKVFEIAKECVRSVKFTTDIPLDSNARTKDVGDTLVITGRILTAVDGDPFDSTRKLALWSAVAAEKADCYRKVTIEHAAAGIMERKYYFPNTFVIDYKEDFGDTEGTGTFTLLIKQKKDKIGMITVEGGYRSRYGETFSGIYYENDQFVNYFFSNEAGMLQTQTIDIK